MEYIFWLAVFVFGYTFVGYPMTLLILNKLFSCSTQVSPYEELPEVEVILVVRNVESIIGKKIDSLQALDYPKDKFKILIVSDLSQDSTVTTINSLNYANVRCIDNQHKSTKSACLNQAVAESNAEILLLTDARQTHEPASLQLLVNHFTDKQVGAVSGELVLRDPLTNNFSEGMDAYWRYEKFIRLNESKLSSVAGVTGAIYAMRREDYQAIPDDTLLDDVLIPMNIVFKGKKVLFEPLALAFDVPSDDIKREKLRKTRTLAGNWQLLTLAPALLNPFKNGIWFQFISHKFLRLVSPLMLLLIFVSSGLLSQHSTFYGLIFILQVIAYATVFAANHFSILMGNKLVRIMHSFLILMWFTVLGFHSFVTNKHLSLWK